MIRLTYTEDSHPLIINPRHIVYLGSVFEGETRVRTRDGEMHCVSESVDEIVTKLESIGFVVA